MGLDDNVNAEDVKDQPQKGEPKPTLVLPREDLEVQELGAQDDAIYDKKTVRLAREPQLAQAPRHYFELRLPNFCNSGNQQAKQNYEELFHALAVPYLADKLRQYAQGSLEVDEVSFDADLVVRFRSSGNFLGYAGIAPKTVNTVMDNLLKNGTRKTWSEYDSWEFHTENIDSEDAGSLVYQLGVHAKESNVALNVTIESVMGTHTKIDKAKGIPTDKSKVRIVGHVKMQGYSKGVDPAHQEYVDGARKVMSDLAIKLAYDRSF